MSRAALRSTRAMSKNSRNPYGLFILALLSCSSSDGASPDGSGASSSGGSSSGGASSSSSSSSSGDPGPPPTHSDGTKNLDETDVDCGGAATDPSGQSAKRCEIGQGCKEAADCTSATCRYDGKCIDASEKSCVRHHGGDTCGPANAQESCCLAIPISDTVKLDKYVITAGRFRSFVEAVNGDIRSFVKAHPPKGWQAAWDDLVPNQLNDDSYLSHDGVYQELGPGLYFNASGGNMGCSLDTYGARTYFVPDDVSMKLWNQKNLYPQDDLDEKALNCVTYYMLSAFCAWDGGRLLTNAEFNTAWGNKKYPWGASPDPQGWNFSWADAAEAESSGQKVPNSGNVDMLHANFRYNWWSPEKRVCPGDVFCDNSVHIAPPGRFPAGNGPLGHADLAGLVFEVTGDVSAGGVIWTKSGTWQGHTIPYTVQNWNRLSKYWATGGRCAR